MKWKEVRPRERDESKLRIDISSAYSEEIAKNGMFLIGVLSKRLDKEARSSAILPISVDGPKLKTGGI